MLKILGKRFPNEDYPPIVVHIFYLLMSVTFCLVYNHLVIGKTDLYNDEYAGIYKVLAGGAMRAIQYRVLVPLIFKAFTYLHLPDIAILLIIFISFTYLIILFFYRILNIYFADKSFNCFIAPVLLYPMVWNFMLLNQTFFFIDHSLLFFLTAGTYFILARKNFWLLVTFLIGSMNHPSITMLILAFLTFNYNRLLKKETIIYTILLIGGYFTYFFILKSIYPHFAPERDADFGLFYFSDTVAAIIEIRPHLLIRNVVLNYGGMYIFAVLFLVTGVWKKIKKEYVFIFLLIIPYVTLGILRAGIRLEEMRNWIPLMPFVIVIALIYLSQIKNPFFRLSDEVLKEKPAGEQV